MTIQNQVQIQVVLSSGVAIEGWYSKFSFENTKDAAGMRITSLEYTRVADTYPSIQFVDLADIRAILVVDRRDVEIAEVSNEPTQ